MLRRTGPAAAIVLGAALAVAACGRRVDVGGADPPPHDSSAPRSPTVSTESIRAALTAAQRYLDGAELDKAEIILARLIERAPREGLGREMMGQVLVGQAARAERRGDTEAAGAARRAAFEQYRVATRLDPDSAGLHHSAGMVALAAGEPAAALDLFERAAELDPVDPQHPLFAAQILIQRGARSEAARHLARVLVIDPDEPLAHASLAVIALEEGRFDEALDRIATARDLAPSDLRLRLQEARIHRRRGKPGRGVELLAGLGPEPRRDPGVCDELAACLTDLGRHEAAAAVWENLYRRGPRDRLAYRAAARAGAAHLRAGNRSQAEEWLEQAQLGAPGAPEVRELRRRLERRPP